MDIKEILSEDYFIFLDNPSSKKRVFEQLSQLAEIETNISSRVILENLIKREKLGSTAVGKGVAIPHITNDDIEKPIGFMALLSTGLDFNATDNQLVDIIFLLIAPINNGSQHLQALASVSRLLKKPKLISKLRGCNNTKSAFAVITQSIKEEAA